MITQKRLKELLKYDRDSGNFIWVVNRGNGTSKTGEIAGHAHSLTGYMHIRIDGNQYLAHRLAFLYIEGNFPPNQVDHINRIRTDNRFINLRHATNPENGKNKSMNKLNTSGITGVKWQKDRSKWRASIRVNYRLLHLGVFDDIFDAICARKSAEIKHGFYEAIS